MPEQTTAAAPITLEQVGKAIADAIRPLNDSLAEVTAAQSDMVKNQQVLADTLKQLPPAPAPAAKAEGDKNGGAAGEKPLTAEAVQKIVGDAIGALTSQQKASGDKAAFVASPASGLAKLPDAYKSLLGTDPAKWADEAKSIAAKFESDFKALGGKIENIGMASKEGGTPASKAPVDLSKVPAFERIRMGLEKLPVASAQTEAGAGKAA